MADPIDLVLREAVETGRVPAVVAVVGDADGALYQGAFGPGIAADTVFAIASMTKPITSVAALQLVERGLVDLDEPLSRHLPELGSVRVLEGFDADGAPRLRPPRRPIALRHLLTHTAGFTYANWSTLMLRYRDQVAAPSGQRGLDAPLVFDPGEGWEYGINIDWVGELVEQLSSQTLEDYFRAHILDPLGMQDTSFGVAAEQRGRVAARWRRNPDGTLGTMAVDPPSRPTPGTGGGGGGLWSTGPDCLRFMRMLLRGGELDGARILRSDTVAAIARNQIGDVLVQPMRTAVPATSNDLELFPGMPKKWGLAGLLTTADLPGRRAAGSWAWAGLYNTYFWVDPTGGLAGALLTQLLPFADPTVLDLFDRFETAAYANVKEPAR
jgi:methyl acetate hydrolase